VLLLFQHGTSLLVASPCLHKLVHSVHVFNRDKVFLEVIIEELVIAAKCENLLLLQLTHDQLLHLLMSQTAFFIHLLDLGQSTLLIQVILMFNNVKTSFEDTLNFVGLSDLNLARSRLRSLQWFLGQDSAGRFRVSFRHLSRCVGPFCKWLLMAKLD
jgi:hypothetical protein